MIFSYVNNSLPVTGLLGDPLIMIEVEETSITEADKIVHEEIGPIPSKEAWVGCRVLREFSFAPPTAEKLDWIENGGYTPTHNLL